MKKSSVKIRKPLAILVLDDNSQWRQIVKSILESDLGISPLVASSGREALDILNARPINVVVSDLNMPVMSGVQFLQRARSLSPKTKVIMMSIDFDAASTVSRELVARGAFAVIPKVEIASKLVNLLRTLKRSK